MAQDITEINDTISLIKQNKNEINNFFTRLTEFDKIISQFIKDVVANVGSQFSDKESNENFLGKSWPTKWPNLSTQTGVNNFSIYSGNNRNQIDSKFSFEIFYDSDKNFDANTIYFKAWRKNQSIGLKNLKGEEENPNIPKTYVLCRFSDLKEYSHDEAVKFVSDLVVKKIEKYDSVFKQDTK